MNAPALDTNTIPAQLATGRLIDLLDPPVSYEWRDEIATPLARIVRYAGQVPGYSVAQHSVHGADLIQHEATAMRISRRTALVAAIAFLLHDAHEPVAGDVTRPFVQLADCLAAANKPAHAGVVRLAIENAKSHIDARIYRAAGLDWPLTFPVRELVRSTDLRMLAEELGRFFPEVHPFPDAHVRIPADVWPIAHAVPVWSWQRAAAEWLERFDRLSLRLASLGGP